MTDREVMQQALYFVQRVTAWEGGSSSISGLPDRHGTLTALKAALEQQAEPPPEWPLIKNILAVFGLDAISFVAKWQAAQRPWQGLTDDEVMSVLDHCEDSRIAVARDVEAKLKERNT